MKAIIIVDCAYNGQETAGGARPELGVQNVVKKMTAVTVDIICTAFCPIVLDHVVAQRKLREQNSESCLAKNVKESSTSVVTDSKIVKVKRRQRSVCLKRCTYRCGALVYNIVIGEIDLGAHHVVIQTMAQPHPSRFPSFSSERIQDQAKDACDSFMA